MNVIDISSWQSGMNLKTMFDQNPSLNGVIVKTTQGLSYVNPPAKDWLSWLMQNKKPFGVYHYLDLYGAEAEARHFVEVSKPYVDKGILAIDYEGNTIRKGAGYLKQCLDEVYRLTGVKPFVYVSQSFIATQDFGPIVAAGYPLWLAQYADMNLVYGFKETPWQKGPIYPWDKYWIHQYSSCGRLTGWGDNLDFNKFYGTVSDWNKLANNKEAPFPEPQPSLKPADPVVVSEVLMGRYGIGDERIQKLTAAGYDPSKVQAKINELYAIASKVRPLIANNLDYTNSIVKLARG